MKILYRLQELLSNFHENDFTGNISPKKSKKIKGKFMKKTPPKSKAVKKYHKKSDYINRANFFHIPVLYDYSDFYSDMDGGSGGGDGGDG